MMMMMMRDNYTDCNLGNISYREDTGVIVGRIVKERGATR